MVDIGPTPPIVGLVFLRQKTGIRHRLTLQRCEPRQTTSKIADIWCSSITSASSEDMTCGPRAARSKPNPYQYPCACLLASNAPGYFLVQHSAPLLDLIRSHFGQALATPIVLRLHRSLTALPFVHPSLGCFGTCRHTRSQFSNDDQAATLALVSNVLTVPVKRQPFAGSDAQHMPTHSAPRRPLQSGSRDFSLKLRERYRHVVAQ